MDTVGLEDSLNVIGYTRVSTDDQAIRGLSLIDQPARIRAFVESRGLHLIGIEEDAGECSKTLKRPGLRRVLAALDSGKARGVVVAHLDRLTRHVGDMVHLVEKYFLSAGGAQLYSVTDHVETRTASGRMLLYILTAVSQHARELTVEKTAGTMAGKRSRSERTGNLRFGLTLDPTDDGRSKLIPCPEDLVVVELMRQLRDAGRSFRAIADELNARGIPSKRGVTKRSTGRWSKSSVADILSRTDVPANV